MSGAAEKQTTSPYASIGATLVDNGYSAIPVLPGAKCPGTLQFGRWHRESQWTRFCDRLPTDFETSTWNEWPNAGVCVALCKNLKVIDIDTDMPELVAAVRKVLPDSPVKKRGAKGFSAFYRGSDKILSKPFSIQNGGDKPVRVVDLLAHGRQTVLPPTLHPDTGRAYEWIDSDTLVDVPLEKLPVLPDNIAEILAEALKPHGFVPEPERPTIVAGDGDSIWREINSTALLNLDAWVPALGLPNTKPNRGGYRAVAQWRGGENANVSFHKDGIRDFAGDKSYSPIDVTMVARGVGLSEAVEWLQERLGMDDLLPRDGFDIPAFVARVKAAAMAHLANHAVVAETEEADDDDVIVPTPGLPERLCHPPGFVGEFANFAYESAARKRSRSLSMASGLAITAALGGRRYKGPSGLRTNVYLIGLAPSGAGKATLMDAIINAMLAAHSKLYEMYVGDEIASVQGLRSRLRQNPSVVYVQDEFGKFLAKIISAKASSNEKEIATALLKLTGAARSVYGATDRAAKREAPIHNPCCSLLGFSNAHAFWGALQSGNIDDGLLGRLIPIDVGTTLPPIEKPTMDVENPPELIVKSIRELAGPPDKFNRTDLGESRPRDVISVPYGPGAEEVFDTFAKRLDREANKVRPERQPILTRVAENAGRLALIVAIGCSPSKPVITADIQAWANEFAEFAARGLLKGARDNIAENDKHAEVLRIRRYIDRSGKNGCPRSTINRNLNHAIEEIRVNGILSQLKKSGEVIEAERRSTNGQGQRRFWMKTHLPRDAKKVA